MTEAGALGECRESKSGARHAEGRRQSLAWQSGAPACERHGLITDSSLTHSSLTRRVADAPAAARQ